MLPPLEPTAEVALRRIASYDQRSNCGLQGTQGTSAALAGVRTGASTAPFGAGRRPVNCSV